MGLHLVPFSDEATGEWFEWVELGQDETAGASNMAGLSGSSLGVGTENHAAQGRAYTLEFKD